MSVSVCRSIACCRVVALSAGVVWCLCVVLRAVLSSVFAEHQVARGPAQLCVLLARRLRPQRW